MPRSGHLSGVRLAIAHHAGHDETGIVEHRAERMAQRIAQLATLVDGARTLRRCVAGNSSGKGKLREQLPKAGLILTDVGINLAVSALQVGVADHRRAAVPRAGDVEAPK